jgi:hypothetical protein
MADGGIPEDIIEDVVEDGGVLGAVGGAQEVGSRAPAVSSTASGPGPESRE